MAEQNLALYKTTSASSFVKPYESARAVNGTTTPTSRWLCNTLPGWLMVDLGVNGSYAYWINRWVVRHMTVAGWRSPDYNMSDFKLQGSNDNKAWYDLDSVVGNTIGITDRTFTAVAYRYVRLYVTRGLRCNPQMASAMELEVYQSPPLSAYLQTSTGLTVTSGALSPAFVNNVFSYTTPNVANSVTSVSVKPTAEDSKATIKVNGVVVASGSATNVTLNVGSNAISVQVIAADGRTTNTYTVTVIRDAAAYLTGLGLATTATPSVTVPYTPTPFNKDITAYSASVANNIDKIVVTPTTDIVGATITVNGVGLTGGSATVDLTVGTNNIPVIVTNGTVTKTYTVTVTRASSPYLTKVSVIYQGPRGSVTNDITITADQIEYSTDVPNTINSVTVTAYTVDSAAKILVNGNQNLTNGQVSSAITVNPSAQTRIPIIVTSNIGTDSKSYGITIV